MAMQGPSRSRCYFSMCTCGTAELAGDSSAWGSVALCEQITAMCFKILLSLSLKQCSEQPDGFGFADCFEVPMATFQTALLPGASCLPNVSVCCWSKLSVFSLLVCSLDLSAASVQYWGPTRSPAQR